ncbi:MAG: winged helix-turn-helix domain-containing protein [Paracoccaceae bacterium]
MKLIRFSNFDFDPATLDLINRSGQRIELRRKSSQVLGVLLQSPNKIVSKSDLLSVVWPEVHVSEEGLTQCIRDIRRALGDDEHKIIMTHVGKGFSINIQETASEAPQKPVHQRRGALVLGLGLLICLAGFWAVRQNNETTDARPRIAVLAFEDASSGEDRGYLGSGFSDGIINRLAQFPELSVVAGNSSSKFDPTVPPLQEIVDALNVDFVLEGSKQKIGEKLIVTVNLIATRTEDHLWSKEYIGDVSDLFGYQTDIANRIGSAVGIQTAQFPVPRANTARVTAFDYHIQARAFVRSRDQGWFESALEMNQRALDADPTSPYGHMGMSVIHRLAISQTPNISDADKEALLTKAVEAAEKALSIAPNHYETHYLRARIHQEAGEAGKARTRFERAMKLNPSASNTYVGLAEIDIFSGDPENAIVLIEKAIDIDPLHPNWYNWDLGLAHWAIGRCDDGLTAMGKMSRIPAMGYRTLAALHVCAGDFAKAEIAIDALLQEHPDYSIATETRRFGARWEDQETFSRMLSALAQAGLSPN